MYLPGFLKTPATALIGKACYKTLIEDFNIFDVPCLKYSLSKGIGFGCVAGGAVVKVPQIIKIVQASSTRGLSQASYLMETAGSFVVLAYNVRNGFPFSTYGETIFITVQNLIVLALMYTYAGRFTGLATTGSLLAALTYALFSPPFVSSEMLALLQAATIPLFLASKVPQIYDNYRNKSTGQLSAFTVFNYLLGTLARVFTTIQEVNDVIILTGFLLGCVFNAVLAGQMVYYWNSPANAKVHTGKKGRGDYNKLE
ncbi:MAG: hypothetical protein DHS80DRAFT_17346 [Piptocephalis tieghemiana]|nr:MAG: hypothetical protein DHS80DRAFT_17346 [Piptocephalis tieghemiana]